MRCPDALWREGPRDPLSDVDRSEARIRMGLGSTYTLRVTGDESARPIPRAPEPPTIPSSSDI